LLTLKIYKLICIQLYSVCFNVALVFPKRYETVNLTQENLLNLTILREKWQSIAKQMFLTYVFYLIFSYEKVWLLWQNMPFLWNVSHSLWKNKIDGYKIDC